MQLDYLANLCAYLKNNKKMNLNFFKKIKDC